MKDYYQILGINKNASEELIKIVYRKLAQKFHPDKNDGDKYFEERFKEISEAYEILSNPIKRKEYDIKINKSSHREEDRFSYSKPKSSNYNQQNVKHKKNKVLPKFGERAKFVLISILIISPIIGFIVNSFIGLVAVLTIYFLLLLFIGTIANFPNITISSFVIGIIGAPTGIILLLYQIFLFVTTTMNGEKVNDTTNNVLPDKQSIENTKTDETLNSLKETSSTVEEKTTKYKGNQLKNGSSPLNSCFGKGQFSGQSYITFENSNASDAIVCLVNYNNNRTLRNEYIQAGNNYTMKKIPTGVYFIKVYYGNDWNPEKENFCGIKGAFENNEHFSKSDNPRDLIRIKNTSQSYTTGTITLYAVSNGNMSNESINVNEFFK